MFVSKYLNGMMNVPVASVARMSAFWKFLETNFLTKVTHLLVDFSGYFEKHNFLRKTTLAT